ncbi:bifunctional 3-(3-hydroxy-phenyl)propionate/3-hydroxycinnamic acid hydroxylase [Novosphingobium sp. FKTRR1]|uniref:bifunctional 3-(3-hydroxy-phenyl)propionate/3-hydroxycinnamic acid hydroxylase MhpA n=1 Tax=Novosphingobium sp. FKTRR1 TaxID=2879118 RepID=UPI001CEFCA92|nr:bifunctional 3-(3-hydroxy-phenyl)propionate/3-hydroxycinnamic acid hydroxylase [Novosphingobium sp. FKTRR1]
MADFDHDVIVAGGGPTGVTLAALLAQQGLSVLVVEKEQTIYPLPRAAHVDHETMRVFQDIGVADRIMATSRSASGYEFRNAKGTVLLRFETPAAMGEGGWPTANMVHQPSIEEALRSRLAQLPLATLQVSTALVRWQETDDAVVATLADAERERAVRARFLIGADGARSPVRKAAGIGFDDLGFEEPWLVVDALVHDPSRLPTTNLQICDPARPTTCVLMGNGRHRWEFMIKPGESPEDISSDAAIARLLEPWQVDGAVTLERKAVYTFRARVAQRWRKGRVLLAGDAAHQTPPFAGQGLCAGIRDAANLAWKLTAVVRDGARDSVLDAYQLEREPHVRATIKMAISMGRTVCITNRRAALARDWGFRIARALGKLPDGPPDYPPIGGGLILAGEPAAGAYFPQVCVNAGAIARSDDGLGPGAWLIARHPASADVPGVQIVALDDPCLAPFRAPVERWLVEHGVDAVLVRPDRYIFAGGDANQLAARWQQALGTA